VSVAAGNLGNVSLEPATHGTEERVRAAIASGATSWRAVGAAAGVSHETARQVGKRLGICPQKDMSRVNVATGQKRRRRPRASLWDERVIARFWEQVDLHGRSVCGYPELGPCWIWVGPVNNANYGVFSAFRSRRTAAHIYSWRLHRGVPAMRQLDHLCHSLDPRCSGGGECLHRRCVNPDHLEPVSNFENQRRKSRKSRDTIATCKMGHYMNEETILYDLHGRRWCRACLEDWDG